MQLGAAQTLVEHTSPHKLHSRKSFGLGTFTSTLPAPLLVARKPQRRKYQKADAGADRAGIVWPRGAQETRVAIVARRDYRHGHARLERRPAAPAVVEHEFEHAVAVWDAERGSVEAGCTRDGAERGADVWVKHREIELDVLQPRVGRPSTLGIVPGDLGLEHLWTTTGISGGVYGGGGRNARCFR